MTEVEAACERKKLEAITAKNELASRVEILENDLRHAQNENTRLSDESNSLVNLHPLLFVLLIFLLILFFLLHSGN